MHSALLLTIAALPFLGADALKSSTTARCGLQFKNSLNCKASAFGNCSFKSEYCGSSTTHPEKGCQADFGDCTSFISTSVKSSSALAKPPSISAELSTLSAEVVVMSVKPTSANSEPSTASTTFTVTTSSISATPPKSSTSFSSASGTSESSSTPSSSASVISFSSVPDVKVSTDGSCGGTQGFTCSGSSIGNCCSEYGWCGNTSSYCGTGCNAAFGDCNAVSTSIQSSSSSTPALSSSSLAPSTFTTSTRTTSTVPSSTQVVSTNGQCGASSNGIICLGSDFGDCCSQYGYCGSTNAFCGTGCQSAFGKCDIAPTPGNTCGVEGFANKAEYYASSFNLIPTTDVSTCATLCLAETTCMSYLFNPGLQNCAYLTYTLQQGEFIATTGTNQLFWDRACAEAPTA